MQTLRRCSEAAGFPSCPQSQLSQRLSFEAYILRCAFAAPRELAPGLQAAACTVRCRRVNYIPEMGAVDEYIDESSPRCSEAAAQREQQVAARDLAAPQKGGHLVALRKGERERERALYLERASTVEG